MTAIDMARVQSLHSDIREGEMRLQIGGYQYVEATKRAISNNKIRIERIIAGMPEGEMVYRNSRWEYEFGS